MASEPMSAARLEEIRASIRRDTDRVRPGLVGLNDEQRLRLPERQQLLAEVERLRTALAAAEQRQAAWAEVVQVVAAATIVCNNYFDDGLPHAPVHVDYLLPAHPQKASAIRAQARAVLASAEPTARSEASS